MRARTGVMSVVPMISAEVMSAPIQCETSMMSWPATPGKKYLLPPEMPTTSCGQHRPDDEGDVVLDDGPVEQHRHVHRQPSLGQLREAGRRDRAEVGEGRRLPPLVVDDGHPGIGRLERALLVAEVRREGLPRDIGWCVPSAMSVGHPGDPTVQRRVDGADEERQRAGAGAVGHDDADALAVEVDRRRAAR